MGLLPCEESLHGFRRRGGGFAEAMASKSGGGGGMQTHCSYDRLQNIQTPCEAVKQALHCWSWGVCFVLGPFRGVDFLGFPRKSPFPLDFHRHWCIFLDFLL